MRKHLIIFLGLGIALSGLIFLFTPPVLVWGFAATNSTSLTIREFKFEKQRRRPVMTALVENHQAQAEEVLTKLVLTDELKDISREISLKPVNLPGQGFSEIELAWNYPWRGWGLIKAEISLIPLSGDEASASTWFLYLPPEMATLSLASLLTLGGFAGRSMIVRMLLT